MRALWAVGWSSTGRRARAPRVTGLERDVHNVSKPHLPTWCGFGGEEPRSTACGGARCELVAQTMRAKSAARSACSVGGRLILHGATRARAARHGTRNIRFQRFEAAAADPARSRWRRASANGMGWSASRVGRADNHAKSPLRQGVCSAGVWPILHEAERTRLPLLGHRTNRSRRLERPTTKQVVG